MSQQFITPSLPREAIDAIRAWQKSRSAPALVKVIEQSEDISCRNCCDLKKLYVSFCSHGPFKVPPGWEKKVITWFDGSHLFGKGWYVVERTVVYPCLLCGDHLPAIVGAEAVARVEVKNGR